MRVSGTNINETNINETNFNEANITNTFKDFVNVQNICINADTYTEQRFFELCSTSNQKIKIFYEWQAYKEIYIKKTSTISLDFQNYSLHDKTHSRSIILSIEKFLGRHRIDRLGIGDLWLLLNAAYAHDIGMCVKYEELLKLWQSDQEFHDYIFKLANSPELKLQEEARYYIQLHNMLTDKEQMDGLKDEKYRIETLMEDWPVHLKKNIMILTNEYIRCEHAERSKNFFDSFTGITGIKVAENRLYKVMSEVVLAHTEDYSYVLSLKKEVDGFEDEKMHPQFIASLLRLGDLLDMDNNRFDPYVIEHFGTFPLVSGAHLNKHISLSHLLVTEKKIEAVEETLDEETAKICAKWFELLDNEIGFITKNWNEMTPLELGGCTFSRIDLQIFLNGHLYRQDNFNKFKMDEKKFMDVIIGNKLYDDSFVFMREYIQNAMDAAKVMLGIKSKYEWANNIYSKNTESYQGVTPLDLNINYLEELKIEVIISFEGDILNGEKEKIKITFRDRGIGIDEECIKVLSVIGTSWRGRNNYKAVLNDLKPWTYPAGGFGIGIQSGFMVTDEIIIITKELHSQESTKIVLRSPNDGGEISVYNGVGKHTVGTDISLVIDKEKFIDYIEKYIKDRPLSGRPSNQWEYIDKDDFVKKISDIISCYIQDRILNSLFPICIKYVGVTSVQDKTIYGKLATVLKSKHEFSYNKNANCVYMWMNTGAHTKKLCLWNCSYEYYAEIYADDSEEIDQIAYRGIRVNGGEKSFLKHIVSKSIKIFMDFYSSKSEDWLVISRSDFNTKKLYFVQQEGLNVYKFYIDALLELEKVENYLEAAAIFGGMIIFGNERRYEKDQLKRVLNKFMFRSLTYDNITESYNLNQDESISLSEFCEYAFNNEAIIWETSAEIDESSIDVLVMENIEKVYRDDKKESAPTVIEDFIRTKLFASLDTDEDKTKNKILFINDKRLALYLDEYVGEKTYFYLRINNKIIIKLGFLELGEKKAEKTDIKDLIKKAVEEKYSYLILPDIKEFTALVVNKLPQGESSEAFCRNNDVVMFPLSPGFRRTLEEKCKEENYTWEKFKSDVYKNVSWLSIKMWVLKHPKYVKQHDEKQVTEQYDKLLNSIYEVMGKRL